MCKCISCKWTKKLQYLYQEKNVGSIRLHDKTSLFFVLCHQNMFQAFLNNTDVQRTTLCDISRYSNIYMDETVLYQFYMLQIGAQYVGIKVPKLNK